MLLFHAESSRVLDELITAVVPRMIYATVRSTAARDHPADFIEAEAIRRTVTWAEATERAGSTRAHVDRAGGRSRESREGTGGRRLR